MEITHGGSDPDYENELFSVPDLNRKKVSGYPGAPNNTIQKYTPEYGYAVFNARADDTPGIAPLPVSGTTIHERNR